MINRMKGSWCRKPPDKQEEEITHDGTSNTKPLSQKNYSSGDGSRIPCGLINQGMTCYLNVVLQTLFMTVKYRNQLRSLKKEVTGTYPEENVSKTLAEFFKKLNSEQRPISTIEVTQALNITNVCEQQDAAEYLQMILHKTPEPSKVFRGIVETTTTCSECKNANGARTEFLSIPLCTDDKDNDVYKALVEYQAVHEMNGDDRLYCVTCEKLNNMETENCITEWPDILTLQLKRFETAFSRKGEIYYRKNEYEVKIPDYIEMYSQKYELYVIINHHGTYSGGHYDVFIKDEHENWFFFNDHKVKKWYDTSSVLINTRSAYLLLYRGEDPLEQTCRPQEHTNKGKRCDQPKSDKMKKQPSEEQNTSHQPHSVRSHSSVSAFYPERLKQRMKQELWYVNEDTLFGKGQLLKNIFIERKMREESVPHPTDDKELLSSNIFEGENIQAVLTKGDAGFGKSVCVQKFVLDWAEERTHADINYMFLIPLQKLNIISENVKDCSFIELLRRCFDIRENLTFCDSDKIMFILDGLNELKLPLDFEKPKKIADVNQSASVAALLTNLIRRNLLPKSLIWITSRPGAAGLIPVRYVDRVTQLNGFNEEQKEEYFKRSISDKSTTYRVINHIKTSKRIYSMCHIPDYCRILATVSEMMFKTDWGKIPETLTQMYATFLIAQSKMKQESSHLLGKEKIMSLGKLAFQLLVDGKYLLRLEDLKKSGISAESITSNSAIIKVIEDCPNKSKSFCFVNHRTQEFLAALYVTEMINRGHNHVHTGHVKEFSSLKLNPTYGEQCFTESRLLQNVVDGALEKQMDVFLSFLLGLSLESSRRILQGFLTQRESSSSSKQTIIQHIKTMIQISPPGKNSHLFDCLIELDERLLVQKIKTHLKYEVRLSSTQRSDLMYSLLNSEEHLDPPMLKTTAEPGWNSQKSDNMKKQQSEEQNKRHQPHSVRSHSSVSAFYPERLKQRMKQELWYVNEDTLFGKGQLLKNIFIERKMREESVPHPTDDKELLSSNIFEGENIQAVLTKGDAGFGKSVCVQKFVLDWAEERTHADINYMFLIPLQKLNIISENVKDCSFIELLRRCFDIRENLTFCDSDKIMFILDGLNELKLPLDFEKPKKIADVNQSASVAALLTNLIRRNLLPKSLIWITSRPGAAGLIPVRYVDRVTQLNGFNEEQKEEYFKRSISDKSTTYRVINHIKTSKRIYSMCHIPDYCRILATVSEMMFKTDWGKIPETLTQMYATFLIAQSKMKQESSHLLGKEKIMSLGKLAFQLLVDGKYLLRLEDLKKSGISAESITSNSAIIKVIEDCPNKSKSFCFVNHRTQEFLAALYVTEMINRGHNHVHTGHVKEFSSLKLNPTYGEQCFTESRLLQNVVDGALEKQMDVFLSFLLGLSLESSRRILQGFLTQRESSSSSKQTIIQHIKTMIQISPPGKNSHLFDCLIELDERLLVQKIKTHLKYEVRLSSTQRSDLMYSLLNSEEHLDPPMLKTTAEPGWNSQKSDNMKKQQSEEQNKRHQPHSVRSHSSVSAFYPERLKQRMKQELWYVNEDTLFGKGQLLKNIFIERKMREESVPHPTDDKELLSSNIFEGENIQAVLTKGDAGFGKSVCVQKFVLDWAEERTHADINYMFLIPLQKLNIISENVKDCSFIELLRRCFDIRENLTFCDSDKIMFILDGLNELKLPLDFEKPKKIADVNQSASVAALLTNLIRRNLLPKSLIWITSRPGAAGLIPVRYVDRVTQLNGFNEEQKEEYFKRSISDKSTTYRVINHIKTSKRIYSMCHIPDYCRILATVSEMMFKTDWGKIPETLTQMYATFLIAQSKMKQESSHLLGKEKIMSLGKLAFQLLVDGKYLLRLEDLKKSGISAESITSNSAIIKVIEDCPNKSKSFCFVNHRTQEFLAALYVTEMINRGHNHVHTGHVKEFSSLKLNPTYGEQCFTESRLLQNVVDGALEKQMDVFLSFLLGLSLESSRRILQGFLTQRESSSSSKQTIIQHIKTMIQISPPGKNSHLFDCLIELDETLFVQEIKTQLKPSSRVEWSALMLVLLNLEGHLDDSHQLEKHTLPPMLKTSGEPEVYQCAIGVEGCSDLSSVLRSNPSHLRELDLNRMYLGDSKVLQLSALLKDPQCKLEKLWLRSCNITEEGCSALSSALRSNSEKTLKELDLSYNDIRDSGAEQLSFLLEDPQCELEKLWLKLCHIEERGSAFLLSALTSNPSHLRELDLSENSLHYSGTQDVSIFLNNSRCRLVKLKLRSCYIEEEGCAALQSVLKSNPSHLRELDLSYNSLEHSGVKHLSAVLEDPQFKLEKLWLRSCNITREGYAALRLNSHLRELDMSNNSLGDLGVTHLSALLKDPQCKLEKLWLRSCYINDTCCTDLSLALRSNPSYLRELDLRGNYLSNLGVKHLSALLEDPHYKLEKLCFTELKESAILSSALTPNPSHLRELDLSYNGITDSGVKQISALLKDPQCKLEKLWLRSCNISKEGCSDLSSALRSNPSHLKELDLSRNPIGNSGVKHLSALIEESQCKLEKLWLRSCYIYGLGCTDLGSALRSNPSHLRELDLSYNDIKDQGLNQLSSVLKNPQCKLQKLWLRSCYIQMSCVVLSSALQFNSHLRELDLSDNSLGYLGVKQLSALLKDPQCKLEKLWLRFSYIYEMSCADLSSALTSTPSYLRELDLSYNDIGDSGVKQISALLEDPQCKLEKLWLRSCNIKKEGCAALSSALTSNSSHLRELDISYNDIGDSEVFHLLALLDKTQCKLDTLWLKSCSITHEYTVVLRSHKTKIYTGAQCTLNDTKALGALFSKLSLNQ